MGHLPDPLARVYGYRMAFILISGISLKLTFKVHFSTPAGRTLLARRLEQEEDTLVSGMEIDFMREYCNMTAGAIRTSFAKNKIIAGMSLPLVTAGFDEVLFADAAGKSGFNFRWSLFWPTGYVVCTATGDIDSPEILAQLQISNIELTPDSDEIEYL